MEENLIYRERLLLNWYKFASTKENWMKIFDKVKEGQSVQIYGIKL